MDHHAVTRKFEIGRDAQSLTLVVPEQFGFSWRDGNCFFPGHIDLLCICMNICIVLGKCQDCSTCRVLPYLRGDNYDGRLRGDYEDRRGAWSGQGVDLRVHLGGRAKFKKKKIKNEKK